MKQHDMADTAEPVRERLVMSPPSIEVPLPTCPMCNEYLANHWRRRACVETEVQP